LLAPWAATVVASLWEVADQPASELVTPFYATLERGQDKSRALRAAQLRFLFLGRLRAGRVAVTTGASRIVLPEAPAFWAAFLLVDEP
jgi:CHAT domain-containing protein